MLRSEGRRLSVRIAAFVVSAGSMFMAHAGCEPIDLRSPTGPTVPVYGLLIDGVADPNVITDQYIVVLPGNSTARERIDVEARVAAMDGASVLHSYDFTTLQGFVAKLPPNVLEQVRYFYDIAWIEANRTGQRTGLQTCPPGNLDAIDQHAPDGKLGPAALLDGSFAYDRTGNGVHVVVVDTGLDKQSLVDFNVTADGASIFPKMCDSDDRTHGHGTMVAEVVAGRKLGVAKNATIMGYNVPNLRCYDNGNSTCKAGCGKYEMNNCDPECFDGTTCSICSTPQEACSLYGPPVLGDDIAALGDIAAKINTLPTPLVVVFPHSFDGASPLLEAEVEKIVKDAAGLPTGAIFVTGAGNNGKNACNVSPARLSDTQEGVITVGSLQWHENVQVHHPTSCVDVYAPGIKVRTKSPSTTCTPQGKEEDVEGSSFAAAHVAGIVALMLEDNDKTDGFKSRFKSEATRSLVLDGGLEYPLLHNPFNTGESGKPFDVLDADKYEDKISCGPTGCTTCDASDPRKNLCNEAGPPASCTGRMRCTKTECAPCGREGSRCCSMGAKCDGNLECNSNDFCACGSEGQACCNGSPAEQCGGGLVCNGVDNKCTACGLNAGDPCCNDSGVKKCGTGLACSNDTCVPACVTSCCGDGATVVLGDVPNDQCIRDGGDGCWDHNGPKEIRNKGETIWERLKCPSLYQAEAVCCDGTRIPLNPQFDENIAKEIAIEECNVGPDSKMRETYMGGQIVGSIFENGGTCGKCDVLCCDGTRVGGDFTWPGVSDQNACMLFGGLSCRDHGGGPMRIDYDGAMLWSKGSDLCPTNVPCIATCSDGSTEFVGDYFDEGMCNLFATKACKAPLTLTDAKLNKCLNDDSCPGDMACVDGSCVAWCRVRCMFGHYYETKTEALTKAACVAWTESECNARGGGDHQYVWFNGELAFNREVVFPGICGSDGNVCCHAFDGTDCSGAGFCVGFDPGAYNPPKDTTNYQICSSCGGPGQACCPHPYGPKCGLDHVCDPADLKCKGCGGWNMLCCPNDKCGIGFTCKPDINNGPKTCQP